MRKTFAFIILTLTLISFASAEIIIHQQPNEIYNLGDTVTIPVTITTSPIQERFKMILVCGGKQIDIYQNFVNLLPGEDATLEASIILTKKFIGETTGTCKVKCMLGSDYVLTNEFEISDEITIISTTREVEFSPGQSVLIKGDATKKNGNGVEGLINVQIGSENSTDSITQLGTINEGFFSVDVTFPENMKAGLYLVRLDAYEKDLEGLKTNTGFTNYNIRVKQVPTSLEIFLEQTEIEPGTSLKAKAVLHDQTGESMQSTAIVTIKKETNEIEEQSEKTTDEYFEFPIQNNEPPSNWTIVAVSNKLSTEINFIIKEKKEVEVNMINETILITNIGNVFYNDIVLIKIGDESIPLNVSLDIEETQEYRLTAPDGEYEIEVISDGESKLRDSVTLTGKAINAKEIKKGVKRIAAHPIVWIFVILILGFVAFLIYKKGHKKSFLGRFHFKKKLKTPKVNKAWENRAVPIKKNSLLKTKNKAELSLSIKGSKQTASVICIKIKNLKDIQSKQGNAEETLQKIVNISEEKKAVIYENQEDLFIILAPEKTKTFKNERTALDIAQQIKKILSHHNKLFKQKIEFGISLNNGTMIIKQEEGILKFMSMGTLITNAKKVASISDQEILLCEEIKEKFGNEIKSEEHEEGKTKYYVIKEIKNKEDHSKFLRNFIRKLEGEKKK